MCIIKTGRSQDAAKKADVSTYNEAVVAQEPELPLIEFEKDTKDNDDKL